MRVHAIQHPEDPDRYLINFARPCDRPQQSCDLIHFNVFTDDALANRDLYAAGDEFDQQATDAGSSDR